MVVGQIWEGPLGLRRVNWHVSWVGTKKARLKADLDYGTAVATVTIARWVASPDTDLISPASTTAPEAQPKKLLPGSLSDRKT